MADMKKVYNDLMIINLYDITKASGLCRFESKGFCFCSYQNLMGRIPISPYILRRPCKLSTTCIGKIAGLGLGFGKLNWRPPPPNLCCFSHDLYVGPGRFVRASQSSYEDVETPNSRLQH